MVKIYTLFQTKMAKNKPIPFSAAHTCKSYMGECPLPPLPSPTPGETATFLLSLPAGDFWLFVYSVINGQKQNMIQFDAF